MVIEVYVKVGRPGAKGQPLFQIANFTQKAELELARSRRRAAVEQAKASAGEAADLQRLASIRGRRRCRRPRRRCRRRRRTLADATEQLELWEEIYARTSGRSARMTWSQAFAVQTAMAASSTRRRPTWRC